MPHKAFITNTQTQTLKKRLVELIEHSKELKFLVGFFYFSGWGELYDSLKDRGDLEIKVLVGLDVDKKLFSMLEYAQDQENLTGDEKADGFFESLSIALNSEELDVQDFYKQVNCFAHLIEANRLKIRRTAQPNHAKLYIFKIKEHLAGIANCKFITGSSNLTKAGIREQNEFNVEIGDYGTDKAEQYFDELWNSAIEITEEPKRKSDLLDLIRNRSQAADVTPFEAYVKVLKTYIDLQKQKQIKPHVQRLLEDKGYKSYAYQSDAVNQALTIIENYNGVVIADVVGLGKSVIASMIAKNLGKRGMIICPPLLMGDKKARSGWNKYIHDFRLEWEIFSSGDLETAVEYLKAYGEDIEVVIIDEAHRYRNQDTQSYDLLKIICNRRQVMLLTATPFNNSPADIFSLLKLFIVPGKSRITLDENLEARFSFYEKLFRLLSYITKNYNSPDEEKRQKAEDYYAQLIEEESAIDLLKVKAKSKELADLIRAVLEPIMIRRNRLDLRKDHVYSKEITELSEVDEPRELFFELSAEQSRFYDEVINVYFCEGGRFTGAIYQPFTYEKEIDLKKLDEEGNRIYQQQRNLFDFMTRLLVKRFESSFGSFSQSIENFISVHKVVLEFINKTNGKYVLERKIVEKAYEDKPEELEQALIEFAAKLEEKTVPKHEKIYNVNEFKSKDQFLKNIHSDIKLFHEVKAKIADLKLVDNDPKSRKLVAENKKIISAPSIDGEPRRKVIVFSEYTDTVRHLQPVIEKEFDGQVLTVAGEFGSKQNEALLNDFDASIKPKQQRDDFCILLASDKLSEGYNLNRAGTIINYDIPWNPTRVIQRVGRINRIGKKVFAKLQIFNFFPTEQGADIVKSRQIAMQKMFLIHNTLGEDCKIFAVDETPSPSELYKRVNTNPEDFEEESLFTVIRSQYQRVVEEHPHIIDRVENLPSRIKTAKKFGNYNLVVFRRKALGLFIQTSTKDSDGNIDVEDMIIGSALQLIECDHNEKRFNLSDNFWQHYEKIKEHRQKFPTAKNEVALEVKAMNNLQTALRLFKSELERYLPFIRDLIKDLRSYHTISKYSLRRIANIDLKPEKPKELDRFIKELDWLVNNLGHDYLDIVKSKVKDNKDEIIIAVENLQ
jgi:superfamily II DNA or RNA helicase/HKD family nuclease